MNPLITIVIIAVAFTAGVAWGRRGGWGTGLGWSSRQRQRGSRRSQAGYSFTEDVRKTLSRSRQEAGLLGNEYVGPEHILLGLIHVNAGTAARVLERLHVETATTRSAVLAAAQRGATHVAHQDLPYTSRAKRVIEKAMIAAREWGHDYVGTEHLLLGLAQDSGLVAKVLADAGADQEAVRRETLALFAV